MSFDNPIFFCYKPFSFINKIKPKPGSGKVVHAAGPYLGFCRMKRLEVFLLLPGWDASPSQGYLQARNSLAIIYAPGLRGAL